MKTLLPLFTSFFLLFTFPLPAAVTLQTAADGNSTLLRDGTPYFIKGVGSSQSHLAQYSFLKIAADFGANSARTWGQHQLEVRDANGKNVLDRAHDLGLSVVVGLWVAQARTGFDFANPEKLAKQRNSLLDVVKKYKNHPAVLIWVVGNEVEIATKNLADHPLWTEINTIAKLIKTEDPDHPTMTVLAGCSPEKVKAVQKHCPDIDILGINSYKGAPKTPEILQKANFTKPWILTEFGAWGPWERPKTEWNAPIEQPMSEKLAAYENAYRSAATAKSPSCLGTFAFNWGFKQEGTSTWFGTFLSTGERLPATDLLAKLWTGHYPKTRCPQINEFAPPVAEKTVPPDTQYKLTLKATSPDNSPLTVTWWIMAEAVKPKIGGDRETIPQTFPSLIKQNPDGTSTLTTPSVEGNYRLFVKVTTPHNAATTQNTPFRVQKK